MPPQLARLHSRALIRVEGDDWRPFLHNLLTQDVLSLQPGEVRFGALLTPQGRLLHDLFLHADADGCTLECAAAERAALLGRLTLYKLRAKATLTAIDGVAWAMFGDGGLSLPRDPRLPALGFRTTGSPARLRGETDGRSPSEGGASAAEPVPESAYLAHQLWLGVPDPERDRTSTTYPIEAGYDLLNGVDFRKGCFIGQETTSRMKRRGVIKTRMLPIAFDGPPPVFGAEILAGDLRAGEVLTGTDGRSMALLRLDRIDGPTLTVEGRGVRVVWPDWMPD